ncbi:gamma-tocopherol methyltransferase [Raphidocelis subcapitata]|uniref:Gamma-tocopherol methyltransferase n=1 Tax=Raphidocelis subcapitata TaxID=307507 RepID=A0A2V0NTP3_9CHLO|nr:gamma-tocopherol methyltransferase [Raphidocelis subcapitata]|eukprot:GBF91004.1 gamma-tocopherol methyltransferase [Raphidocelis subcapitata]
MAATTGSGHAEASAKLYDGVGELWLKSYGEHVHIGLYEKPIDKAEGELPSWGDAQSNTVQQLIGLTGLTRAKRLLDVGCGHGATACDFAEALNCDAVGINISPFQVDRANALAHERGLGSRAKFLVADGMAPPFEDGSFDLVVSVESAAYMPDKKRFISELSRVLAPGGTIVLADFCRKPGKLSAEQQVALDGIDRAFASAGNWHSADQYKRLFASHGLTVAAEADWTGRLRGFWDLSMWELLLRRDADMDSAYKSASLPWNAAKLWCRFVYMTHIIHMAMWRGCFEPFWMSINGFVLGANKRTMHTAFGSGALQYRVIVARKPLGAAKARPLPPLVIDVSAASGSDASSRSSAAGSGAEDTASESPRGSE